MKIFLIESNINFVRWTTMKKLGVSRYWIFVNDIIEWNSNTVDATAEQNLTVIKMDKNLSFKALTGNIVKLAIAQFNEKVIKYSLIKGRVNHLQLSWMFSIIWVNWTVENFLEKALRKLNSNSNDVTICIRYMQQFTLQYYKYGSGLSPSVVYGIVDYNLRSYRQILITHAR